MKLTKADHLTTKSCLLQKHPQCVSETGAGKTVDNKVGGGVQHDYVPHHGVHHPSGGRDVVLAFPFHAFKYVRDGGDLVHCEEHLG